MKTVGNIIDDLLATAIQEGQPRFYWESESAGYSLSISLLKNEEEDAEE